jgi:hypothetical protein
MTDRTWRSVYKRLNKLRTILSVTVDNGATEAEATAAVGRARHLQGLYDITDYALREWIAFQEFLEKRATDRIQKDRDEFHEFKRELARQRGYQSSK